SRFELRYYAGETDLRYYIDKVEHPIADCKMEHKEHYETALRRYKDMGSVYQVIQQRYDLYDETLTEIRKIYGDDSEEKWQYRNNVWNNITTEADYEGL
ncbi:MAG: hypothetical protein JZU63_13725, partial [Rhodoferax sp.]|nr:hypothetical protein [Rhodoferax sp.]